jgi:tRNA nucleotidyltransferase (CCA-adding enzyme)
MEGIGFSVLRTAVSSDESTRSAFLFLLSEDRVGKVHGRKGPEYFRAEEIRNYYKKNRKKALLTWIGEDGRVESIFERHVVSATNAIELLLSRGLDSTGISDEVKNEISKGFKVMNGRVALKKDDWLGRAVVSLVTEE